MWKLKGIYTGKNREIAVIVLEIVLTVILVMPFFATIPYTMPSADDYTNCEKVIDLMESGYNRFETAGTLNAVTFMEWQGNYFGVFLEYFLLSFWEYGVKGIRIVLLINLILFFTALYAGSRVLCSILQKEKINRNALLFLNFTILAGMNLTTPAENLYWLTGACIYTIPFSLALFGGVAYYYYINTGKRTSLILSVGFGVLAAGGVLQVAGIVCFIYLVLLVIGWKKSGLRFWMAVPFGAAFLGAVVNTLAPGNYVRHDLITAEGLQIGDALINTVYIMYGRLYSLLHGTLLPCLTVFLALVFLRTKQKYEELQLNPVWIWIGIFCGAYISVFPVMLGYNAATTISRAMFILDLMLVIGVFFATMHTVIWMKRWSRVLSSMKGIGITLTIILIGLFVNGRNLDFRSMIIPKMIEEQRNGVMRECRDLHMEIIQTIKESKEDDVIIEVKRLNSAILKGSGLSDNKEHWINMGIASFYDKNSIIVLAKQ